MTDNSKAKSVRKMFYLIEKLNICGSIHKITKKKKVLFLNNKIIWC